MKETNLKGQNPMSIKCCYLGLGREWTTWYYLWSTIARNSSLPAPLLSLSPPSPDHLIPCHMDKQKMVTTIWSLYRTAVLKGGTRRKTEGWRPIASTSQNRTGIEVNPHLRNWSAPQAGRSFCDIAWYLWIGRLCAGFLAMVLSLWEQCVLREQTCCVITSSVKVKCTKIPAEGKTLVSAEMLWQVTSLPGSRSFVPPLLSCCELKNHALISGTSLILLSVSSSAIKEEACLFA